MTFTERRICVPALSRWKRERYAAPRSSKLTFLTRSDTRAVRLTFYVATERKTTGGSSRWHPTTNPPSPSPDRSQVTAPLSCRLSWYTVQCSHTWPHNSSSAMFTVRSRWSRWGSAHSWSRHAGETSVTRRHVFVEPHFIYLLVRKSRCGGGGVRTKDRVDTVRMPNFRKKKHVCRKIVCDRVGTVLCS